MTEAYNQAKSLISSILNGGALSLHLTDWIWLLGAAVLVILAVKVAGKLFKFALVLLALALAAYFLYSLFT